MPKLKSDTGSDIYTFGLGPVIIISRSNSEFYQPYV